MAIAAVGLLAAGGASAAGASAMGAAMIGMGVAGALSSYQSGQQQKASFNYQADVAQANADATRKQGEYDAVRQAEKSRKFIATQEAIGASSGFEGGTGTLLDLAVDSAKSTELDRLAILHKADTTAIGYENQRNSLKYQGKVAEKTANMQALTKLASAVGTAYITGGMDGMFSAGAAETPGLYDIPSDYNPAFQQ